MSAKRGGRWRSNRPKEDSCDVRYFTYYLYFPNESEPWCVQIPFIHHIQFELKKTKFAPEVCRDLLQKGESHWKDHNGVTHRVVVEDIQRPRRWGIHGNR